MSGTGRSSSWRRYPAVRTHKQREKDLETEGWTRQFVANEPRLSEAAEMYRELGFEVLLEPLPKEPDCGTCGGTEGAGECRACFNGVEHLFKIIYTRPYKGHKPPQDELF